MPRRRILVADDDPSILEIIELMLCDSYDVFVARDGRDALRMYDLIEPDLVLLDIAMPIMDGIEVAKRILERNPDALIVGVSAHVERLGEEFMRAGAKALLSKPFTKRELRDVVDRFIEMSLRRESVERACEVS